MTQPTNRCPDQAICEFDPRLRPRREPAIGRFWFAKSMLVLLALACSSTSNRCAAQYSTIQYPSVQYPTSQPVITSYPSSSYPTSSYPTSSYPTSSYPSSSYPVVSYPGSQPVITSYPSSTYPAAQSYPTASSVISQPIRSSVVTHPTRVWSDSGNTASTSTVSESPIDASQSTNRQRDDDRDLAQNPLTRLASTRDYDSPRYDSQRRDRYSHMNESRPWPVEPPSPYGSSQIESARQSEARFRSIAQSTSPTTATVADENADLAQQWIDLATAYNNLSQRVDEANTQLRSTQRDFDDVNSKITHYGLTPTVGLLLRHKKEQLDLWQVQDSQTLYTSSELGRSRQKQLELEMVRHDGSDPTGQAKEILTSAGLHANNPERSTLSAQIQNLLDQRRSWLSSLQQGYQDYQHKLSELDSASTESAKLTDEYRQLIDRHVTWIRSGDPLAFRDLRNLKSGIAALFDSRRSQDFGYSFGQKWEANPVSGIGLIATILVVILVRLFARSWLVSIGNRKKMKDASDNSRKVVAGLLTTLLASLYPYMLYAIGNWLSTGVVSESTLHAASGFFAASLVALGVEVPRQLLRTSGYIDKHVDITLPGRERAFTYLTLIGFGLVLAAYVVTLMGLIDRGMWRDSVARFGFIAALSLVAWTAHRALRPNGGYLEPLIAKFGGKVIHRVRYVLYIAGIGFPLAMIALSSLGYGFTANELIKRAIITMSALSIAATVWAGVKIVSAHLWQMLTGSTPPPPKHDAYGPIDAPNESEVGILGEHFLELKHHLAFLCQCALVLGAIACIGWMWLDVFPNARMGNPVVWTIQDTITETSLDATGDTITNTIVTPRPVTAFHLLLAVGTLFIAFQVAKLLPALFDALVLQRVSFDEGMEHFTLVMGRCLLFGIGCLIACTLIGVRWQTIQWLAVGLMVGLGFGLQDMVRNLFGGLIVLFEKPARLGDFISVGKVTGRVAAQKFRTTVLSDDDGREVIVPNKNFVSEEVVNWMGAGRLSVIPIEVAVTRDERPADICRTLQELIIDQPDVLLTPAPQATLVCVGKRSQRIELRAWIEDGSDASRFRDSLLTTVRRFLDQKKWLASVQPSQPSMRDLENSDSHGSRRSPIGGNRKRSA
ncbi:putative MscS family protein.1 precursor [Rubripirellula tenax]|uniref:Putative MscS family protein.1 n=1 Tax=Rubripirellula tenax TaxID=2528015 RepID=A0A5C6FAT0_9BACT|nr:mechanosensitive ion channel domain-containing protein [Rubripirellula tenax]TWU56671.1 putative MscS family protein.1 precursor [Rubripirellula tenax]